MAFNISDFKSTIDYYGGVARSSLFEVRVSRAPGIQVEQGTTPTGEAIEEVLVTTSKDFDDRALIFFCKAATIPGITFNTATYEAVSQLPKQFPVSMSNTPFTAVFMVDSDHQVLKYFHRWMQEVLNIQSENPFSEVNSKLPYEVGYKDSYAKPIEIRHYSTESDIEKYYLVKLDKAFPIAVGDIELAWESNDSYLVLPVTFAYDNITYSGANTGTPSSRFSRGRNLLDTLGAIAGFSSVVQQTFKGGRPTSIQDAINRLTRVRSSYDNISRGRGR